MKLCSDILYWRLKEVFPSIKIHEKQSDALTLQRPQFYLDKEQHFEKDHVYVCSADHLPTHPILNENVCIIALGDHANLSYFYDRCCVITLKDDTDIFRVFNAVQSIFDKYEAWEENLWHILRHDASLSKMIEVSKDIFLNPMLLIGSDFRYLAVSDEQYLVNDLHIQFNTETFDAEKLATFLSLHDMSTHIKEPLLLNLEGRKTLSVNLFDQDEYLGCLTIFEAFRDFHPSDKQLSLLLAKLLRQAIQQNPLLASSRSAAIKALRSIVSGDDIDFEHRRALSLENNNKKWLCVKIIPQADNTALPSAYLSTAIGENYPGALAFEYEKSIISFFPLKKDEDEIIEHLLPFLEKLDLICGISSIFTNLFEADIAYYQAYSALKNGMKIDKNNNLYHFDDYILNQLLTSALDGKQPYTYYPEGLKKLKEHDDNSKVSYIDTLRVLLNNNLSVTKTASDLYLHRSTLMERLTHITNALDGDLKDPDYVLLLKILLRCE